MFMNIIKLETEVNDLKTIIKSKNIIEKAASNMKPISEKTECKSTHEKVLRKRQSIHKFNGCLCAYSKRA